MSLFTFSIQKNCYVLPIIVILLVLSSCTDRENIKAYYFPIDDLQKAKVYEYKSIGKDSLAPYYWFYRTIKTDTAQYFTGQFYNQDFIPEQFFREEIVENGSILDYYLLFETDSTGFQRQNRVEVLAANVFPFEIKDSSIVYLYKVKWSELDNPAANNTLIKNRRFVGYTEYNHKGKSIPAVEFLVDEAIDNYNEGHFEAEFKGKEIYGKNIGLVYFKKVISEGLVLEYKLTDIYDMKGLEQKFKKHTK